MGQLWPIFFLLLKEYYAKNLKNINKKKFYSKNILIDLKNPIFFNNQRLLNFVIGIVFVYIYC